MKVTLQQTPTLLNENGVFVVVDQLGLACRRGRKSLEELEERGNRERERGRCVKRERERCMYRERERERERKCQYGEVTR